MSSRVFVIRLISLVAVIAVAVAIFAFSAQPAKESKQTSDKILELVEKNQHLSEMLPEKKGEKSEKLREYAHILLFMLLGISSCAFMYTFSIHWALPTSVATVFCALYSLTDELHQKLVDGRAWELKDLCYDAGGYMAGIALVAVAYYILKYAIYSRRNKQ